MCELGKCENVLIGKMYKCANFIRGKMLVRKWGKGRFSCEGRRFWVERIVKAERLEITLTNLP